MTRYALVEMDPQTGEIDHLIDTGSFRRMSADLNDLIEDFMISEWDEYEQAWPAYAVMPVEGMAE